MKAATLNDALTRVRLPEVAARLGLTLIAVRHAIRRRQWHRIPPPDDKDPYRWKIQTLTEFQARPPTRERSSRGYRPHAKQSRMFDRIGKALVKGGKKR